MSAFWNNTTPETLDDGNIVRGLLNRTQHFKHCLLSVSHGAAMYDGRIDRIYTLLGVEGAKRGMIRSAAFENEMRAAVKQMSEHEDGTQRNDMKITVLLAWDIPAHMEPVKRVRSDRLQLLAKVSRQSTISLEGRFNAITIPFFEE